MLPPVESPLRTRAGRGVFVLLVVLAVVAGDQASKLAARQSLPGEGVRPVVGGYVILVYAENDGGFLSLGSRWPVAARHLLFVFLSVGIVAALLLFVLSSRSMGPAAATAYALLAGGGVSNLIDRILHAGRVVDFLNIGIGPVRTGIFNLADVAILAGIALLLSVTITAGRRGKPRGGLRR